MRLQSLRAAPGGRRFVLEDVERGSGKLVFVERIEQSALVDDAAARAVDDIRVRLQQLQLARTDDAARTIAQRDVQRHDISTLQKLIERDERDIERVGARLRNIRIVAEEAHPECACTLRHVTADASEADDPERFSEKLGADEWFAIPAAGAQCGDGVRRVAREREHQPESLLRCRQRVRTGRIENDDAGLRRGIDVDRIDTNARASDGK